jgi:cell division protein FtsQ
VARQRGNSRNPPDTAPGGLWHQPALMTLLADVLIVVAVAGLAWSALTALQRLPVFPLRELVLTTTPEQVSTQQLEHAARGAMVGNFFTVDLDAVRGAFEKLPWVRKASVSRNWPDGLRLTLEEHEPVARWRQLGGGEPGLVNRQGEVFFAERPADAPELPQLTGPEGSAREVLTRYGEFSNQLAGIGRQIDAIALSPRLAWRLKLDDGVAIELGRDQSRDTQERRLGERLERFVAHYDKLHAQVGAIRIADMRYPNGFVLSGVERARPARPETAGRKS